MEFVYEPALLEYMQRKGKKAIIVEVAEANCTDFEVQELHIHFITEKQAAFFIEKKHFHPKKAPLGQVLLPNYRLDYADTVTFGLKSFLGLRRVTQTGIKF